jgi:hypothetical protein
MFDKDQRLLTDHEVVVVSQDRNRVEADMWAEFPRDQGPVLQVRTSTRFP